MNEELQKAIANALVILIPALVSWIVSRLTTKKVEKTTEDIKKDSVAHRKDTDAAFLKLRAHEEVIGIQTKVEGGVISVTTNPGVSAPNGSLAPSPVHQAGGAKGG